jgi:hypothetical protein
MLLIIERSGSSDETSGLECDSYYAKPETTKATLEIWVASFVGLRQHDRDR